MTSPPNLFDRIYARHGHRCPMSTLGGRLALAALGVLGEGEGPLAATYHARTCALDGIGEVTGCIEAEGSLRVTGEGRHALRLERGGLGAEAELTARALELAGTYRTLCLRLDEGWESLLESEKVERETRKEQALDRLLPILWEAPEADLVTTGPPVRAEEKRHD